MIALVTGGTGFVGSHLIESLRSSGDTVRAIVRRSSDREQIARLGGEPVQGELGDLDSLRDACRGCDVVYHAAARVEILGDFREFHETTVMGTERLVQAAREAGVRRFVYVSSCGVYHPKLMSSGVINESTPSPPPPKWFVYGRTKLAAEEVVRKNVATPMEWVIIRLGYLYGPRNRALHRYFRPFFTAGPIMLIGSGNNEMTMLYVHDAARAVALAGRSNEAVGRTLIAAGNERITQRIYLNTLADGFGVARPTKSLPYPVAYVLGWIGEWMLRLSPRLVKIPFNRSVVALTGLPQRIDDTATQQLLNWKPQVRFADGMQRAFDWYAQEYAHAGESPAVEHAASRS